MPTILCVDDEPAVGVVIEHALSKLGHHPLYARGVDDAIDVLRKNQVELILSDYQMPKATGLDLLRRLEDEGHEIPVIMMTGYSSVENAVTSIKSGAIDYLTKPVRQETLRVAVEQALEVIRLRRENANFRRELGEIRTSREIVGESAALRKAFLTVGTVAPTRATVLLEGESGTGKELFARAIHDQSPRSERPFVTLNCAALPEGLVESALFGHEKGAFTGATARSRGAFERANGGTLLLDEISEMRVDLQAKLLRVIQEQEFERVGGSSPISVDVRLIATTNRDLKVALEKGEFREDLYYRLAVVPIRTPPLREHLDDIPLLVRHFVRKASRELEVPAPRVSPEAVRLLQAHRWPGNVRELGNVVERAVIMAGGGVIGPDSFAGFLEEAVAGRARALTDADAGRSDGIPPEMYDLREIEAIMIQRALHSTEGNRSRAAKLLGVSERTLRNKLNTKAS